MIRLHGAVSRQHWKVWLGWLLEYTLTIICCTLSRLAPDFSTSAGLSHINKMHAASLTDRKTQTAQRSHSVLGQRIFTSAKRSRLRLNKTNNKRQELDGHNFSLKIKLKVKKRYLIFWTGLLTKTPAPYHFPIKYHLHHIRISMFHSRSHVDRCGHRGDAGDASPPPDLKRCWHDPWFHWKSSPKYFCTAHYLIGKDAKN